MIYDSLKTEDGKVDYAAYSLDDLDDTCRRTYNALREIRDEFDSIIVTGMSGVVVGVPVALKLEKPVVIVRKGKDKDDSHQFSGQIDVAGTRVINRYRIGKRTVIVDDFRSSGETEFRLIDAAKSMGAATVATYWYRDNEVVHHDGRDDVGAINGEEIPF